jgi:cellulose synthase (UDP-forming)
LPDDQRFFFEAIMPSRDAWNAAFCCGSNSVTRRAALRAAGDALPTGSITEDMLLSLVLLRKGYITRYLCERLAFGLAPESLGAFFVQRQRWARGAIQILYLPAGPLGRGLSLMQRLMFLPTHWISQGLMLLFAIVAPLVFLWTGIMPFANVTDESVLFYLVPMILALVGGVWVYAPKSYFPLASQVLGTFQSFKILPTALATLVRPFGHRFKVTPKGQDAAGVRYDRAIFWTAATLLLLTIGGLIINTIPEYRMIASGGLLPVVAVWSGINALVLFIVCMLSLQAPARRAEERFQIDEPIWLFAANGALSSGRTKNLSLSGVALIAGKQRAMAVGIGERVGFYLSEVGFVRGTVVRVDGSFVSAKFDLPPSVERDLLIRKLFTAGLSANTVAATAWSATWAILGSIWSSKLPTLEQTNAAAQVAPSGPQAKLPRQSVVIPPSKPRVPLAELSARRRDFAA